MQTEKVISQRLAFGTVFRIVLTGNLIGTLILVVIPMFVLSLMSAFGVQIFKSGDGYLTGVSWSCCRSFLDTLDCVLECGNMAQLDSRAMGVFQV